MIGTFSAAMFAAAFAGAGPLSHLFVGYNAALLAVKRKRYRY